ncbi:retrovirus-related pol polyprotein from transposon TNT 1-94 [Tanacetum coccineum]
MIPAIYIQQFWDTMCFNSSTELYSCQLDEQWFNLHKYILTDALNIAPANDNNPFVAPPSSNVVIKYVNTLGPQHAQECVCYGITHRSNIDYAKRIWEEFVQSIQTFLTDKNNLATASRGKKKTALLLIQNIRFTKLIIYHLRTKYNIHPRTSSPLHYSHDENVLNTLRFMGKDERSKAEEGGATESSRATKVTIPKAAKVTKPVGNPNPKKRKLVKETPDDPLPAKRLKASLVGKRRKAKSLLRLIDEPSDEGVPVEEPAHDDEEADLQWALELSLKEQGERTQGPAHPVVLREPYSRKFQPLPEVQGKGKEKVIEEEAAHDLLTLQTPMKKKSDEEASKINARNQEEGQAGPNPGVQDECQARPNPGVQDEGQAGPNPDLNFTHQFFVEKTQEEEPGKTNAEVESQSDSSLPTSTTTISTITTTTTPLPPPP